MATENNFAKILTDLRESRGAKRQEVADQIGISRASLEYYEKGKRKPDVDVILKLADYYGVTCDYLLRGVRSSFAEIHKTTGLSDKSIEILQNILTLRKRAYIDMLNFLIEETDFGGYRFYNSTLKSMYEYFLFKAKDKEFIISSNGDMIEITDKSDEDVAIIISETAGFGEVGFVDDEDYDEIEIRKVNSAELFESFKFEKLTEQIKESKAKYLKQKGEEHGNHRKEE